ncbi:LysR family transcriptional regulator [Nocardia tengchongensis]|uniref:LysR family transcriptional regulator n=1 Tax=Nocardia tengchongensis TaxID=2055889 RepID=UPI0036C9CF38
MRRIVDLDLRLLRYFVTVADELHFGRAAAKLYISQPALSKQIRRLEDQLGSRLLERDSRHVTLTDHGHRVLADAREMIALATRIGEHSSESGTVRIAHVFELQTSRIVADAFAAAYPDVPLVERSLDSLRQLDALLDNRLDVAILRVTAAMAARKPTGWRFHRLRLEPMFLVGRPGDPPKASASLFERPVEVFADAPASGLYNAHGDYLTTFERHAGMSMRWLGNPGTFGHCVAAVRRATDPGYVLEFESYAVRYGAAGIPIHRPVELQPYYPWCIAWRDEPHNAAVANFLGIAEHTARQRNWHLPPHHPVQPWIPPDDPTDSSQAAAATTAPRPRR